MTSFMDRVIGAAKLDVRIYEEVEADTTATGQAMAVVVLSSIAAGIGSGEGRYVIGAIGALLGWGLWAFLCYVIGTKLLPEANTKADVGELLRTIGFAASPGILRVFGVLPLIGWLVMLVTGLWMLASTVVAVRQALDYTSTLRAVGVCIVGWLVLVTWGIFVALFVGGTTALFG
ncbi:MAG: hypothetical protein PVH40_05755 [Gemmatimonadales bacterium]|jgi:hypothetical protein